MSQTGLDVRVVKGACPHDCPDTCALETTVENGVAIKVAGAKDHPWTDGTLCTKVARYLERTYAPDRVVYPHRRVGGKGPGKGALERISWDEALDTIAAKFRDDRGVARRVRRRSARTATRARWACSTTPAWIGGSSISSARRCSIARLLVGRQGRHQDHARRRRRHGPRTRRRRAAHPDLGIESDHLEPALLVARAGGQAPRRQGDRDRSVPQPDGREGHRAHSRAAGHRRGARAGDDARDHRRERSRRRLRRALHGRLRRARRARAGVSARARRRDLRHSRGDDRAARARVRHARGRRRFA